MVQKFAHKISLGQNFLNNPRVIERSLEAADLSERDAALEIGSGQGVLTRQILESPVSFLHALEIDTRLEPWLTPLEAAYPDRFKIIWGDALECRLSSLSPVPNKVVANIPYNITTRLVWKVLAELAPLGLDRLILLVQKEAAERLSAPPCSKNRYPLGVTIEMMGEISTIMKVSPGSFTPPPSVWSSLISIRIDRCRGLAASDRWRDFIASAFAQRRKKLLNNLAETYTKERLESAFAAVGISPAARAEELTAEQWKNIFEDLTGQRI